MITLKKFAKFLSAHSYMLFSFSIRGWVRFIKLKIFGKIVIIQGECNYCGDCCRNFCIDLDGSWISTSDLFNKLSIANPAYKRCEIICKNDYGDLEFSCSWLLEDGTCRDYCNSLSICKKYPNTDLYFTNCKLPARCSYSFKEITSFKKCLEKFLT